MYGLLVLTNYYTKITITEWIVGTVFWLTENHWVISGFIFVTNGNLFFEIKSQSILDFWIYNESYIIIIIIIYMFIYILISYLNIRRI